MATYWISLRMDYKQMETYILDVIIILHYLLSDYFSELNI